MDVAVDQPGKGVEDGTVELVNDSAAPLANRVDCRKGLAVNCDVDPAPAGGRNESDVADEQVERHDGKCEGVAARRPGAWLLRTGHDDVAHQPRGGPARRRAGGAAA